ncbi:MAG TPA: hypothetical protein VNK43_03460 [Gemmatimonadales bacterium]|nr:hypothetical protein [Gemmatimonadales bacterium]
MSRPAALRTALAATLALAACETDTPYQLVGGPVYDFRIVVEGTAAGLLPGGTVQLFTRATTIDSARIALRGLARLASGGYTVFAVDERAAASATPALTGLAPDSLGRITATVPGAALATTTTLVVGFGAADFAGAHKPLYFQFRNPTTGALVPTGSLTLGRFDPPASTRFVLPPATRWGRAGLWIDRPARGDIWLRGYILHVPLAPNGFLWHAWAVQDSLGILKSVAPIGPIADSLGNPLENHETAPAGTDLPELPKVFIDATRSRLGVPLERFTHLHVTLQPRGAAPGPSPAVVYRGTFPQQFLLRPKP